MSNWKISFETENKLSLNKPLFIEGLPGIGNVGKIAVDFLIEELKAKKLCSFFSHSFPNSVFVNEKNLIEMPKIELYYKKFQSGTKNGSKKRDILLLTGDIQPMDEESCYTFCEEILKLIAQYQCKEIITTGGIGLQQIPETPLVYCTSNNKQMFDNYTKKGSGIEKEIFGVVGPIIGVSGVLLGLAKTKKVDGVALLAETFGHPLYLGIKGAKELLKVLEKRFKFGVDVKKLNKEIIAVEKELMQKTEELFNEPNKTLQAGATAKHKEVNYIG